MPFSPETLRYETRDHRAYITLNRPERLNAITAEMGREIAAAVAQANDDDAVRVIVVQGAGRAFSSGYDLKVYAEGGAGHQGEVWDPIRDYRMMRANTDNFFTLWRSLKPTIAKVHGYAVAGGSDSALSCDLLVTPRSSGATPAVRSQMAAGRPFSRRLDHFDRMRQAESFRGVRTQDPPRSRGPPAGGQ